MSPNRIVAFLTPLVFAPLAGVVSTWAAENLPGVNIPQESMQEIFIAGALIALAPAAQWLYGWQKNEAREAAALALGATTVTAPAVAEVPQEPDLIDEDFSELDDLDELDELDDFDEFDDSPLGEDEPVSVGS
jgi:peptidoglycan/LPS O-acetylase OafA/YrhL